MWCSGSVLLCKSLTFQSYVYKHYQDSDEKILFIVRISIYRNIYISELVHLRCSHIIEFIFIYPAK